MPETLTGKEVFFLSAVSHLLQETGFVFVFFTPSVASHIIGAIIVFLYGVTE